MRNSFTKYLHKYSMSKLNYLSVRYPWHYILIRILVLILFIGITIKGILHIFFKFDLLTSLALGDYAPYLPKVRHFLIYIHNLWFYCGLYAIFLFQRTNNTPKMQVWFHSLSILDIETSDWTNNSRSIIIYLFLSLLKCNLFLGAVFSFCLYIPMLIRSETDVQLNVVFLSALHGATAGYCCADLCVNFSFIFAFYSLNSGLKYKKLAKRLNSRHSTSKFSDIDKLINGLLELLIENHKSNSFWTQLNSTVFLLTFIAQIPILYSTLR